MAIDSCHKVFVSFRGSDTRNKFISHLYAALRENGISAFKDDVSLAKGDTISSALVEAIEGSKIALVVLSENYAESQWCLEELGHILECKRKQNQVVMPVFYGIDPSYVRRQKDSYARAFDAHERRFETGKVVQWRSDLEEVGKLSGWESSLIWPESELVDQIVCQIQKKLSDFRYLKTMEVIDAKLDVVVDKIDSLEAKMDVLTNAVEEKFDSFEVKTDVVKNAFEEKFEDKFDSFEAKVDVVTKAFEDKFDSFEVKMSVVKKTFEDKVDSFEAKVDVVAKAFEDKVNIVKDKFTLFWR